jgi:hypothetical protein
VHQSQCVTLPELVTADGSKHAVLLFMHESSQLVAKRRPDFPAPKLVLRAA